jgi:hypothetical protein
LLIASIGVATVNYVAACSDRQSHTSGNLVPPPTINQPTGAAPPVSGTLVPPLTGGVPPTSGNLVPPPAGGSPGSGGSSNGGSSGSGGTLNGDAGEAGESGESGEGGVPSSAGNR